MQSPSWTLYLVETSAGNVYCGICTSLQRRFKEHASNGKLCAKALRGKGPLTLKYASLVGDRSSALKTEYWLKQQNKGFKLALIEGLKDLPHSNERYSNEELNRIQNIAYKTENESQQSSD
ncbi:GIY-YIG nuclease family protein [Aliiglaciecola sp.]|nr:GIY-YIG nuclease family protein [Aliiglaciecola sp.]